MAGKKYKEASKSIDREKRYALDEAIKMVAGNKIAKFDETVETAIRLNVDPRQADQNVRGTVVLPNGTLFLCDTHMVLDPTAEQIAEMTLLAADAVRGFGIIPKAALVSHSSFGASDTDSARKMRRALAMIRERAPKLEIDGEMHADAALVQSIRDAAVPDSRLNGIANLLIMPNLDSANIGFTLVKAAADGLPIGPMLLGMTKPIHVVVPTVTARGIVNLSALAVVAAQETGEK